MLVFQPFAFPVTGTEVVRLFLSMDQTIIEDGPDRDTKDQRFMLADGTSRMWLADCCAYTRKL